MIAAFKDYISEVRSGSFPAEEHSFQRSTETRKIARLY